MFMVRMVLAGLVCLAVLGCGKEAGSGASAKGGTDEEAIQGYWRGETVVRGDMKAEETYVQFEGNKGREITKEHGASPWSQLKLDGSKMPKEFEMTLESKPSVMVKGIYEIK